MLQTPSWWNSENIISCSLAPLSALYGWGAACREYFATPVKVSVPVLCIGNLTAGGAGKTPAALAIGKMLKERGINAFYVSRGYGGTLSGPVQVDVNNHTAAQTGDEPLLLARVLPTIVCHNRVEGAKAAIAAGARLIILDDGLQNPTLQKDMSLIVVDGVFGFGNGMLIPAGPLRETLASASKRAHGIILIGGDCCLSEIEQSRLPIFFASLAPSEAASLRGKRVLGFAGIARPGKFRATLDGLGAEICAFVPFPDHHAYRRGELEALVGQAHTWGAELMTTEKDAVRVPEEFKPLVRTLPVSLRFTDEKALLDLLSPLIAECA